MIYKSPETGHYFCGYYGKRVISGCNKFLLSLEVETIDEMPPSSSKSWIVLHNLSDGSVKRVCEVNCFNWQQGNMLEWLGPEFDSKFIFNDFKNGRYVSCVFDLAEQCISDVFPMAVYDVSQDGQFAYCLGFERLDHCRPSYSYRKVDNKTKSASVDLNDGIWRLGIVNGDLTKILDAGEIISIGRSDVSGDASHYFEHGMVNQSGTKLAFLHRWKYSTGEIFTRLLMCNTDGSQLKVLLDSGRIGHFCWAGDAELIVFGVVKGGLHKLRATGGFMRQLIRFVKPMYNLLFRDGSKVARAVTGKSYFTIDVESGKISHYHSAPLLDGHPVWLQKSSRMLSDVYPQPREDGSSAAYFYAYDPKISETQILGSVESTPRYDDTGLRCDLHPKVSVDETLIALDALTGGRRSVLVFEAK